MNALLIRKLLVVSMIIKKANETEKYLQQEGYFLFLLHIFERPRDPKQNGTFSGKCCISHVLHFTQGHLGIWKDEIDLLLVAFKDLLSLYLRDVCELLYATTSRHAFNYGANDIHVISSRPPFPHFGGIILNSKTQKESFFSCNLPGGISPRSSMAFLSMLLFFGFLKWSTTI